MMIDVLCKVCVQNGTCQVERIEILAYSKFDLINEFDKLLLRASTPSPNTHL